MPDKLCHECSECGVRFGIFVRRHHCRICGRIFCSNCSSHTIPAMRLRNDINGHLRVCLDCHKIFHNSQQFGQDSSKGILSGPKLLEPSNVISTPVDGATSAVDPSAAIPPSPILAQRHSWEERSIVSSNDSISSPNRVSTIEFDNPLFFRRLSVHPGAILGDREENILEVS